MQSISRSALRFHAHPRIADELLTRIPRFANLGIVCKRNQVKLLDRTAEGVVMEKSKTREETNDVRGSKTTAGDKIWHADIIDKSSHRDGAIYKKNWSFWGQGCPIDLADCSETVWELDNKDDTKEPCYPDEENCRIHFSRQLMQIFSLKLAKTATNGGTIQLYGYLAAWDDMDGRVKYVFKRSRDNPVILQEGSLIEMTGPRRAIVPEVLMEFDMRIKTGEKEEDDLQLIDGLTVLSEWMSSRPFTLRFDGSCGGAVDMCLALVCGMEAVIEVAISEVQRAFDLSLSSFVYIVEEEGHKEIQQFHGAISELSTKRFAVAVPDNTVMHLRFKVGRKGSEGDSVYFCSFDVNKHGCVSRQIKIEAACVLVKVTVSDPI